ncbi:glycogen debranching N-terminal domain-containing protein [Mesorhizobium sp. M0435]|uniref:glycogen debranching N-terminal domain-containing protein n=1 Tax=unclassified Mesorhizobium TaxID=325217 RepID=UPI003339A3F9
MLERITFTNYFAREIALPVRLDFDADFRDMFEVRGTTRSRRGRAPDALIGEASVTFRYEGLDNVARQSVIAFSVKPDQVHSSYAEFRIVVPSRDRRILHLDGRSRRRDSIQ